MSDLAPKQLLDLVCEYAPKLRQAGVLTVELDDIGFTLAAAEPPADHSQGNDETDDEDIWNDPKTYGRTKSVPGAKSGAKPVGKRS